MSDDNFIGQSKHGGGFTKTLYLYLKSEFDKGGVKGGHNIFRVLPPLFSLAQAGKYAAYHSVHKFLVSSQGKMRQFECIEESDYKTKMIKTHCPVCDLRRTNESKLKLIEEQVSKLTDPAQLAMAKERVKAFRMSNIEPYTPERRFWLNVVTLDNSIGLLQIPSRSFTALKTVLDEYSEKDIDLTGINGVFLDFRKVSAYKGDAQVQYPVEFYRETVPGSMEEKKKMHTLTTEVIARLKKEARDLTTLFKRLTAEQITQLLSVDGPARAALVDSMFGRAEEKPASEPLKADIGGTGMTAVGDIRYGASGVTSTMPDITSIKSEPTPKVDLDSLFGGSAPSTPATTAPAAAPTPTVTTMSDDDFAKMFS